MHYEVCLLFFALHRHFFFHQSFVELDILLIDLKFSELRN